MTKTLHDKIEIHPGEPPHMTMLKIAANATLEEAAELNRGSQRLPDNRVEHLLLRSGNQMVPWSAIRRIPTGALTAQVLLSLLTF
jgi:hypothetical protein